MENVGKAKYYAFISHKSADSAFALKMQKFIESYNLPTKIQKATNSPKRLTPVCSYEVDFSSNPLLDEMREKLSQSKFLILICSKDEVPGGSKYVNYEIETFIECKRAQGIDPLTRIIPIVVNGEFDGTENACCPSALKALGENCPIAVERKKFKTDREVFMRAISGMLDIDHVVLEDRDRKRRNRRRLIACSTVFALAVAAAVSIWCVTPKQHHYLDFVMQNGVPVGIEELSKAQYTKTAAHYVITTQLGKVKELKYVNSHGKLIDHTGWNDGDRPARYVFDYDSKGLNSVSYYGKNDNPYFVMNYAGDSLRTVDFKDASEHSETYYIGNGYEKDLGSLLVNYNLTAPNDISRFCYTYDQNGFVTAISFRTDSSDKLSHDNGVFGFAYELDSKGRIIKTYFTDAQGNYRLNSEGIYCKEYIYDENNNLTELKNYNRDGALVSNADGVTHLRRTFDDNHNIIKLELLDASGAPVVVPSYGSAVVEIKVDAYGNQTEAMYHDENGQPMEHDGAYGLSYATDSSGWLRSRTYLDAQKQPCMNTSVGYAVMNAEYDDRGNIICYSYTDTAGNLVNNAYGYARIEVTYNAWGQETRNTYYTADGSLADYRGYGYSIEVTEYDSRGRDTAVYYLGQSREPVNVKESLYGGGFHKITANYEYGAYTKISNSYYDKDGKLVNMTFRSIGEAYAQTQTVIQNGEITSIVYYDKDGKQYGDRYEISTDYNAQAEKVETEKYFDQNNVFYKQVIVTHDIRGVEKEKLFEEYDNGVLVRKSTIQYDENGIWASSTGVGYDENGTVIYESSEEYDADGNEIHTLLIEPSNAQQYSFETWTEYTGGIKTKVTTQSKTKDGAVILETETEYDAAGRRYMETMLFYDENTIIGAAVYQYIYQEDQSYTLNITRLNAAGEITGMETRYYDSEGNQIQ